MGRYYIRIHQTNPHVTPSAADPFNFGSSPPATTGIVTPRLLPRAFVLRLTRRCTARWDPQVSVALEQRWIKGWDNGIFG